MEKISRRSLSLSLIGFFFVLQGIRIMGIDIQDRDYAIFHELIPLNYRSFMWISTGLVTMVWAWAKHWQWVAVVSATIMPIERFASYTWSGFNALLPGPPSGLLWSFVDALSWLALYLLITVISGWIEWDKTGGDKK